jgi:enoyl-CoA hydratase
MATVQPHFICEDAPMSTTHYTLQDGIATITLDNGKANVINLALQADLNAALDRAEADQAVVVITGRAGLFSGGFDLSVFKTDPVASVKMLQGGALLARRLMLHPQPVLAACSGHAVAMGAFLLLGADWRLAMDGAFRIHAIEVQVGMTLPHFFIGLCKGRLSPAHWRTACATAWPYTPTQAREAGFVDEVCASDAFAARVQERAAYLKGLDAKAFTATKRKMLEPVVAELDRLLERDVIDWNARFINK